MPSKLLAAALLCSLAGPVVAADPPKRVLLVGSPADTHPPTTHEYMAGVDIVAKLLRPVAGVEVTVARSDAKWADGPDLVGRADVVVLYRTEGAKWVSADPARLAAFRALAKRGGGLVCLHIGMACNKETEPIAAFVELFGGCHGGPDRKFQVLDRVPVGVPTPAHPAAAGIKDFVTREEFYYKLKFAKGGAITPVLRATIGGEAETVAWAWERPGGGRSFGFSGLHYHDGWARPEYRRVVAQGVLWAAGVPVPPGGLAVDLTAADLALPKK